MWAASYNFRSRKKRMPDVPGRVTVRWPLLSTGGFGTKVQVIGAVSELADSNTKLPLASGQVNRVFEPAPATERNRAPILCTA